MLRPYGLTRTYSCQCKGVRRYERRYNRRVIATARPGRRLLLASNNAHKLAEYRALFTGLPFMLQVPKDLGLTLEVAETGRTFTENAVLKAQAFARAADVAALADDSGLEVDALGGLPGTRSRRYAGEDATNADRMALLLERLRGVVTAGRTARFRCVIAVAAADGSLLGSVEGTVEGLIAARSREARTDLATIRCSGCRSVVARWLSYLQRRRMLSATVPRPRRLPAPCSPRGGAEGIRDDRSAYSPCPDCDTGRRRGRGSPVLRGADRPRGSREAAGPAPARRSVV